MRTSPSRQVPCLPRGQHDGTAGSRVQGAVGLAQQKHHDLGFITQLQAEPIPAGDARLQGGRAELVVHPGRSLTPWRVPPTVRLPGLQARKGVIAAGPFGRLTFAAVAVYHHAVPRFVRNQVEGEGKSALSACRRCLSGAQCGLPGMHVDGYGSFPGRPRPWRAPGGPSDRPADGGLRRYRRSRHGPDRSGRCARPMPDRATGCVCRAVAARCGKRSAGNRSGGCRRRTRLPV
jgi:hypothetical protein